MFRPCILTIVKLYYNLYKQLYNMCVWSTLGGRDLVLQQWVAWPLDHYGQLLIQYNNALVYYYKHVENQISVHKSR